LDGRFPGFFLQFDEQKFTPRPVQTSFSFHEDARFTSVWTDNILLRIPYSEYRMGVDSIPPQRQGAAAASKDKTKPLDASKSVKVVAPLGGALKDEDKISRHTDSVDNLFEGER
jgi:hypothetical protein